MNPKYEVNISEINLFSPGEYLNKLQINNVSKIIGLKRPKVVKTWDVSLIIDDVLETENYYEFKIKHGVDSFDNVAYIRLTRTPIGYYISKENLVYSARFQSNPNDYRLYTVKVFQNPDTFLLHLYIFLTNTINSLPF